MTYYPLLFRFHAPIIGNGFIADVDMRGRALVTVEHAPEDGCSPYWIDGVMPGGLAAGGANLREAHAEFIQSLVGILSDTADECQAFEDFKKRVTEFFETIDVEDASRWEAAVRAVRAGECGAEFLHLGKLPADDERSVRVVLVDPSHLSTDLNRAPKAPAIAA